MSPVTTPAVFPNVIGQPGPHGPPVTAAVESAYSSASGTIIFQCGVDHISTIYTNFNKLLLSLPTGQF